MSITITAARWANPERSRVIVITAERGAVLLKPTHPDWHAFATWQAAGNAVTAYAPPVVGYRDRRAKDYALELGADPGDVIKTLGDVLDVAIREMRARGVTVTPEFTTLTTKIDAIKARHPKPPT